MAASNLARATVNIRRAALIAFYKSQGLELKLAYFKPNNQVPYFFDENYVAAILNSCTNLKHFAMLNLMCNFNTIFGSFQGHRIFASRPIWALLCF